MERNLRQHQEILTTPPHLIGPRDCPPEMLRARQMLMRPATSSPGGRQGSPSASECEYLKLKKAMSGMSLHHETKTPKWPGTLSEVDVFNTALPAPFPVGAEAWWERRGSHVGTYCEEEDEPIYHHERLRTKSEKNERPRRPVSVAGPGRSPQRSPARSSGVVALQRRRGPLEASPHLMLEGSPARISTDDDLIAVQGQDGR